MHQQELLKNIKQILVDTQSKHIEKGWLKMRETDMDNPKVKYMICALCHKKLHPLDAHMIRINGKLDVAHIDCCNEIIKNKE